MNQQLPFFTSHTPLALALEQAGERMIDMWNVYTPDRLATLSRTGEPLTVAEAHAKGLPGSVSYFFAKTATIGPLVDAWNDQTARMDAADRWRAAHPKDEMPAELLVRLERPEPEDVVRIIASAFAARKAFQELWKTAVPKLQIARPGDIRTTQEGTDGSKTLHHPGFRLISANASKETREHLKL